MCNAARAEAVLFHLQELRFFIAAAQLLSNIRRFVANVDHPAYPLSTIRVHPLSQGKRARFSHSAILDSIDPEIIALVTCAPCYVAMDVARLLVEILHPARNTSKLPFNHVRIAVSRVLPLLQYVHGKR